MSLLPPIRSSAPLLCYVTDRSQFSASPYQQTILLREKMRQAASAGVDWIQIREKNLSTGELSDLAQQVIRSASSTCRVIINDRLDVACAVGAGGVHLGEKSIPVREARRFADDFGVTEDFLIGASVHSLEAAQKAKQEGANYLIFGPVFATPSKVSYGTPQGLEVLTSVCRGVSIPVLAIGGITAENAPECYACGAAGIAAVRAFQETLEMFTVVGQFRSK